MAKTIALVSAFGRIILDIECTRERLSVIGPSTAVGKEVLSLDSTGGGIRMSKVITATDKASRSSTSVVSRECRILVGVSLRRL